MKRPDPERVGRDIAEKIGERLTQSGALDSLLERGQDPDPDAVYIYNDRHAWQKGGGFFDREKKVEAGVQRVHKVRRGERGIGYEFEFVDEPDVVYTTNYPWALVLDTRENFLALLTLRRRTAELAEQRKKLRLLRRLISLEVDPEQSLDEDS